MKNIFEEVKSDYIDGSGNISIDAYMPPKGGSDDEDCGKVIAMVTLDGNVIDGQHPEFVTKAERNCPLISKAIHEAIEAQKETKQKLIDKALELFKKDIADGDLTAINELLMFCPVMNLQAYLPEQGE